MDELTVLRQQMDSIKKSLEESKIVNRKLMVTVMKQKSSWLNNYVMLEVIALPLLFLLLWGECVALGVPVWFSIVFIIGAVIDVIVDFKTTRIPPSDFARLDMLSLRRKLTRQKRQRYIQLIVSLPLALAWGAWFVYECNKSIMGDEYIDGSMAFWINIGIVAVTVIACIVVVLAIYKKMNSVNDDIIGTIDDSEAADRNE